MLTSTSGVIRSFARPVCVAALVAVVIVSAAAVGAGAAQTADSPARLQGLVNDLGLQLRLSYRANLPEYQRRYDQLGQAIAAWNGSTKSDADRAAIAGWLRQATLSSMPGSGAPMPAVPQFDQLRAQASTAATTSPVGVVTNKPVVPDQPATAEELPTPQAPTAKPAAPVKPQPVVPAAGEMPAAKPADVPRAQPADTQAAPQPSIDSAGGKLDSAAPGDTSDFWLEHPAANDLPGDLRLDDPFKDDPTPNEDSLRDLPSLFDSPN